MRDQGIIKWTTKEGKEIPVNEMSDVHLVNTINMLRRNDRLQELADEFEAYLIEFDC